MNCKRIVALVIKEFLLILKDKRSRFVIIIPPLLQFMIFGYAATYDLQNVRYALLDESQSTLSRQLIANINGSQIFTCSNVLTSQQEIAEVLDRDKARFVLHIGQNFAKDLASGKATSIQVLTDGKNPNVAMIALGYLSTIITEFNKNLLQQGLIATNGPQVDITERSWFNANLRSRWFMVSALGGIISMVVVMILTSLSVAREREFGTFDQLLVAPFSPSEILLGKSLPGIFFGLLDALIFAAGAVLWFHVPFRGTISALIVALLLFIITMVGVALFISSLSMTMQQALLGSFIFMMPAITLSGLATPIENMPHWLQIADYINPIRYIIAALRIIFLQGADLGMVWPTLWPLLPMAAITLPVAAWLFRARSR